MKIIILLLGLSLVSACTQTGYTTGSQLPDSVQSQDGLAENMVGNEVGHMPPDFTVTTTDGKTIKLSEYASEKPTVVYFMATWCPYCKQEYETLKQVFPEYEGKINLLSISLDTTETSEILKEYKDSRYVPGDLAPGSRDIVVDYDAKSTTARYAIKDGEIIFKNSGAMTTDQWRRLFDAMLA